MKNTTLSKRRQARIFEACVESALLFDAAKRTWYMKDLKKLQQWADKCYRYIWSRKTEQLLRQMEREGRNVCKMWGTYSESKTIRWKVERRVLQRIGHVMRMDNERATKEATLGWLQKLEEVEKCPGRKRKTVSYWKKLIREAGWDWTEIDQITSDRNKWRKMIDERMKHLEGYERGRGHHRLPDVEVIETRNIRREETEEDLICKIDECGKKCKSKARFKIHRNRMHKERVRTFRCGRGNAPFKTKNTQINHEKTCGGARAEREERRKCEKCGKDYSKNNFARHRRACTAREGEGGVRGAVRPGRPEEEEEPRARVYRAKWSRCP